MYLGRKVGYFSIEADKYSVKNIQMIHDLERKIEKSAHKTLGPLPNTFRIWLQYQLYWYFSISNHSFQTPANKLNQD